MVMAELKKRLFNRGTLAAILAFIVAQLVAYHIIPTAGLAEGIKQLINDALNLLVVAGIINNAGIGSGYSDIITAVEAVVKDFKEPTSDAEAAQPVVEAQPVAPEAAAPTHP